MNTIEKLFTSMREKNSLVCVGLDPDYGKLPYSTPTEWGAGERKMLNFLKEVVRITAPHICSYKIQKAFYDLWEDGHNLLKDTIDFIHSNYPEIPVFLDCKIGDIDNTMTAYMKNIFENMNADGVLLNPYMGDDVIFAMRKYPNKAGIVLVQTSNVGSNIVQNYHNLWKHILNLVINRWNICGNLIPVISSTSNSNFIQIRKLIPDQMPILLAGYGAQGGDPGVLKQLLNKQGIGVFVNSSRGILYPCVPTELNWRKNIEESVIRMKEILNQKKDSR